MIVAAPRPLRIRQRPAYHGNYGRIPRGAPSVIVIHCTDGCEGGASTDDNVAAMFADPNLVPKRSAHYVVDADSVTQCVPDLFPAWHAGHNGNRVGLGIELCGRASQTREQWLDAASLPTLCLAARLVADLCAQYGIPVIALGTAELLAGAKGVATHATVGAAWHESTHTDPGEGYPLAEFLAAVVAAK